MGRVWTTKTGKRIKIRDMSDAHLSNAIRMLERKKDQLEQDACYFAACMSGGGEMASYYADQGADAMFDAAVGEVFPIYDDLLEELDHRDRDKAHEDER